MDRSRQNQTADCREGRCIEGYELPAGSDAFRDPKVLLQTVVEGTPLVLFGFDRKGVFTLSDGKGLEALGLEPGEMVGRSVFEVYGDAPEVLKNVRRALSGEAFSSRVRVWGRVFESRYDPLRDTKGTVIGALGVAVDITSRWSAEQESRKNRDAFFATFEGAGVGIAHIAPNGRWLRANRKLSRMVGYPHEEMMGLAFEALAHPRDVGKDREQLRRVLAGEMEKYSVEKRYVRKDRRRIWVKVSVSPLHSEPRKVECLAFVIDDITEMKLKGLLPKALTDREISVLRCVAAGKTNPQIASELAHSLGTIKLDLQHAIAKLGSRERKEAATRALEIGLLCPPP